MEQEKKKRGRREGKKEGEEGGGAEQKLNKAADFCNKFILGT